MPEQPLITVLITNYNTSEFVKLSVYALEKLTLRPFNVFINDNGSKKTEIKKLKKIAHSSQNIHVFFRNMADCRASFAHAQALDFLIDKVQTKYTVILDSDCTFLLKGWDEHLIGCIDEKVKIAGTPLPRESSGLKPHDFPMQFAVIFETQVYKNLNITCRPGDIQAGEDTCWMWKPKFLNAGFDCKILEAKNSRTKEGPFSEFPGVAAYYTDSKQLIASHFGRGSSSGAPKYLKSLRIPFVLKPLKKFLGKRDKQKWMAKCYEIIDNQS